jgi:excisionase family DNA binding protein
VTEKLGTARSSIQIEPEDILTAEEVAAWLKVPKSWVFEQTRKRAKLRCRNPLPVIRLGKYVRFSREQVSQWMAGNGPK